MSHANADAKSASAVSIRTSNSSQVRVVVERNVWFIRMTEKVTSSASDFRGKLSPENGTVKNITQNQASLSASDYWRTEMTDPKSSVSATTAVVLSMAFVSALVTGCAGVESAIGYHSDRFVAAPGALAAGSFDVPPSGMSGMSGIVPASHTVPTIEMIPPQPQSTNQALAATVSGKRLGLLPGQTASEMATRLKEELRLEKIKNENLERDVDAVKKERDEKTKQLEIATTHIRDARKQLENVRGQMIEWKSKIDTLERAVKKAEGENYELFDRIIKSLQGNGNLEQAKPDNDKTSPK